ncbi:MAG: hypothetical protein CSB47_09815 [Proteobacteria bacterium]|nr:MAG: hypothetical protein CSB47_09815 [Pseudomonadota bacterium]
MEQAQPSCDIIAITLKDEKALHANYMPFIKGGGLYAETNQLLHLGDEVVVSVKIESLGKKFAIPGKVVWVSSQRQGVGVQFVGRTKDKIRALMEFILGDLAKEPSPSRTY